MTVKELIEKRAKVWETAKNFVDTHEDKNGNLSAEDKETYSRMEAEIEELTNSIERQQRAERREQELSKPVNSPITGKPYKDEPQGEVKTGRASDEYKKAMLTALRSNFRQVSNVLQEGVDADGGYLVPEEYDHRLIDVLTEENIMRGIATKITTSGEHKINIAATKPAAAWIEEGEALSFGDATFEQKILDAHKLHVAMVTDAMSALGMETAEADTMVDQMAKTASTTNTSVAQLGEGILTIGATAKSIKGGTAELNTALGILANNGIKGAEGGTHLRNIILSLQNPTDQAAAKMQELGVSVYDSEGNMRSMNDILGDLNTSMEGMTSEDKANIISTIFNKTDLSSVNALLANTGSTWDSLQSSIENSAGSAQQMADTQLDNLQGQLTLLKSALEGLAISFGQLLMPAIKSIVGVVQKVVDWLNSLDEGTKKVIVTIALVVAAIGPMLIVVGKIISSIGTIMTVIPKLGGALKAVQGAMAAFNAVCAANPYVLIIAAIVALIAIFVVLWNMCDGFRQFWINLWEGIKSVISTAVEAIKGFFTKVIDFVKNNWQGLLLLLVNPFAGAFKLLYDNCEGFRNFIDVVLEKIKGAISAAWEAIKTGVTTVWTAVSNFFITIWEGIKNIFNTVLEAIKLAITTYINFYKTIITTVFNAIKTVITTIWNAISTFFTTILNTIKTTFTTVWTAIQTAVTTVINAIKTVITTVWNAISTAISTVMNTIKNTISTLWNGIKTTITTIVNGIKTTVSTVFNNILSAIKTTVGNIASSIKSGFQTAISYITSLPSQALQWGKDMIMGIVNGIKSCMSAVGDAVKGVADKIKSFLHFSVPDEGPLTDYESWMPDFMDGLAKGIDKSKKVVAKAVEGVSQDMVINPNVSATTSAMETSNQSAQNTASIVGAIREAFAGINTNGGDTVIPVYIGGTMLDEIVVNAQQRINLRSGGR